MSDPTAPPTTSESADGATGVAGVAPALQTPALCIGPAVGHVAPSKRGLQRGLSRRRRTVILFLDSRIFNEIPPLRAMWAPVGQQAQVPIVAARATRVLTGVLNIKTSTWLSAVSDQFKQADFQWVLRLIRARWRGWHIVLFLDRHPAHRAKRSRQLARHLGIQLRWLPTACPELNPVDHLWRHVTQDILANEPTPHLDVAIHRAEQYIASLPPRQRLRKAGVLTHAFWLARFVH